eukprot:6152775-Amphidinium_carterae.1
MHVHVLLRLSRMRSKPEKIASIVPIGLAFMGYVTNLASKQWLSSYSGQMALSCVRANRDACRHWAKLTILVFTPISHNHPSGSPTKTNKTWDLTRLV